MLYFAPSTSRKTPITLPGARAKTEVERSAAIRALHLLGRYPRVFSSVRVAMGGGNYRRRFVHDYVGPCVGMRVLDLGCGPATVRDALEGADYIGVDLSNRYTEYAASRVGPRSRIVRADVRTCDLGILGSFDVVIAMGLLHHLSDDDVRRVLRRAASVLDPEGRLVTVDSVKVAEMYGAARWLMSRDRGDFVRTPDAYRALAAESFELVGGAVRTDLLRVPLTRAPYPVFAMSLSVPARATSVSWQDSRRFSCVSAGSARSPRALLRTG